MSPLIWAATVCVKNEHGSGNWAVDDVEVALADTDPPGRYHRAAPGNDTDDGEQEKVGEPASQLAVRMRHDTSIAPRDPCHLSVSELFDASMPAPLVSSLLIFTLRFVCRRNRYRVPLCHVLILRTHGL